jgi:FkbM family methyltransferase
MRLDEKLPTMSGIWTAFAPPLLTERREARAMGLTRRQLNWAKAWHLELLPSLSILEHGLALDVGAHEGLWTQDFLKVVPSARVIAVEPQDDLRATVEARFAADDRVTVLGCALADREGSRTFHLMGASVNGSLYEPNPDMDALYRGGWEEERTVTVETRTVDAIAGGSPISLLKIDVQGAEHEVLAGATETLNRTSAVMLEVEFLSHYAGDVTFPALHEWMAERGFRLTGISEPAKSPGGAMLCSDACYVHERHLDDYFQHCQRAHASP